MGYIAPLAIDFNHTLVCPNCGDDYLHHGRVEIFQRSDEDAPSIVISVDYEGITAGGKNPSLRRDGLLIYFSCEGCGRDDLTLAIWQHKGQTCWGWQ